MKSRMPALMMPSTPSTRATNVSGNERLSAATASDQSAGSAPTAASILRAHPTPRRRGRRLGSAEFELSATYCTEKSLARRTPTSSRTPGRRIRPGRATAGRATRHPVGPAAMRADEAENGLRTARHNARMSAIWPSSGVMFCASGRRLALQAIQRLPGGMYFSSCFASTSSATNSPSVSSARARRRPALHETDPAARLCRAPERCACSRSRRTASRGCPAVARHCLWSPCRRGEMAARAVPSPATTWRRV